jgi:regulator of sigma E protease
MNSLLFTVISFLVALGVLITVHEYGHFWVARRSGVKVLRFSIGFGPALWQRTSPVDGVEYVIGAIPLGGYVKMLDEREEPVPADELQWAFNRQSLGVRSAIVSAGPLANFLFAIIAFWLVFMLGDTGSRPVVGEVEPDSVAFQAGFEPNDELLSIGSRETPTWELAMYALLVASAEEQGLPVRVRDAGGHERMRLLPAAALDGLEGEVSPLQLIGLLQQRPSIPPVIGELVAGEAAAQAGLQTGDRVLTVDGEPVADWVALVRYIQARPNQRLQLEVERAGTSRVVSVQTGEVTYQDRTIGRIGAGVQEVEGLLDDYLVIVRLGPLEALGASVAKTWDISGLIFKSLGRMITGEMSVTNISGPISIAVSAGKTASYGLVPFLKFLAWVSISLGVLNLLPIPVLDGGHLLFFMIERLKGSPLSEEAQLQGQRIGFILLLMLMGLAFYVDIARLLG